MSLPVRPRLPLRHPLSQRPSGEPRPARRLPFRPLTLALRRAKAERPPAAPPVWRSVDGGHVTLAPSLTVNLTLVEASPLPAALPSTLPGAASPTERTPFARPLWQLNKTTATTIRRPLERETQPQAATIGHPPFRSLLQQLHLHLLREARDARPPAMPLARASAPSTRLTYSHLHHSTAAEPPSPAAGQRLAAAVQTTLREHTTRLVDAALRLTTVGRAQSWPLAQAHPPTGRLAQLALHRPPGPGSPTAHRAARLPSRPSPTRSIGASLAPARPRADARTPGAVPATPALHLLPTRPAPGRPSRLPATSRWHAAPLLASGRVADQLIVTRWRPGARPSAAPSLRLHTRAALLAEDRATAPASRLAAARLTLVMRSDVQRTRHHTVSRSERHILPVEIRWRDAPAQRAAPIPTPAPPAPPAAALPDMARLTREVTRELEKRVRVERQRRGRL